ncbi:glycosyltransferase family 4 protein [bacterium]|nr:glycosyltransferase family 4 protein [bacterium]
MNPSLHIVFLHPSLAYQGGAELSLLWLATGLHRLGQKVTIISGRVDEVLVSTLSPEITIYNIDKSAEPDEWSSLPPLIMDILGSADVISPHNYPAYLWLAHQESALPPVVLFCQEPPQELYAPITQRDFLAESFRVLGGFLPWLSQSSIRFKVLLNKLHRRQELERRAMARCQLILANSAFTAENIQRIHGRQASVCHLGVPDYVRVFSDPIGQNQGQDRAWTHQILLPGRLSAIKNAGLVLESLFMIQNQKYGLLQPGGTTLIGDGWQKGFLKSKLGRLGLDEVVNVRGQISHHDMSRLYQQHQIVLYVPFDEPFGLVAIEAMASARPVIGSNQGGILETIADGETGLLVSPHSADEIAQAVLTLLTNRELCQTMGQAGYARYSQQFTLERFATSFLDYCRQVVRDRGHGPIG